MTESEVETQVAASSKGEVAGNVLIWFLCAIAFLKVSQKIDSFMASLGINVGHTGGSLLAEAMVAMRAITMVVGGNHRAGGRSSPSGSGASGGGSNSGWFLKGGLAGVVSRHITNSAVKTATTQTSAVHTAQSSVRQSAASASKETSQPGGASVNNDIHTGGVDLHAGGTAAGAPTQEGVIVTGAGASAQEGVIVTGAGASAQEGVIVTGAGAPSSGSQADGLSANVSPAGDAALTVPQTDSSIPDTPAPDGITNISQVDGGTIQESVSVETDGTVLIAPQAGTPTPAAQGGAASQDGVVVTGGERHTSTVRTSSSAERSHTTVSRSQHTQTTTAARPSLGGMIFSKSLAAGGSFANDVIGTVARGEVAGSITGDMAAQSLASYMGYTAIKETAREVSAYTDVEIGQGRITGVETEAGSKDGLPFAMYHAGQYATPSGEFQKVFTADGTQWYKQYAQDTVERKPYKAPDDTVAYQEKIVKKLPAPPRRKDRM